MKKLLVLAVLPCIAFGLNNSVTITDTSKNGQTGRPFSISRIFACGEFPKGTYPQPHVLGGDAISPYQADVMTTCADGSVRHAIVSFTASIPASQSLTVDFVQSPNRTSDWSQPTRSDDQDAMLAFNNSGWGGKIEAIASSITGSASARTMMAAGYWRYWLNGPVVRQVIIEDRYTPEGNPTGTFTYDFGFQCDSSAGTCPPALTGNPPTYANTAWKAAADSTHNSLHPIFVATFYTGWSGVKLEFILENPWFGKAQDQQFDLTLYNSPLENNSVYKRPGTVFSAFRRMRETFWDGTAPNGWVNTDGNGGQTGVAVNLNRLYMQYSKAIPFYDPYAPVVPDSPVMGYEATEAAASYSAGSQTQWCGDGTANGGLQCGNFNTNVSDGGAHSHMAVLPRPYVRYLGSFSALAYQNMIDNAQGAGSLPIALRESTTGKRFVASGDGDAFGRIISIDARPQFKTVSSGSAFAQPKDRMVPGTGIPSDGSIAIRNDNSGSNISRTVMNANVKFQSWTLDAAHLALFNYVPYIATGDWYYLEGAQFEAMWYLGVNSAGDMAGPTPAGAADPVPCYYGHRAAVADPATGTPDADYGFVGSCTATRAMGWALNHIAHAWFISPDGSPERAYFAEKLDRYLGILEGALNLRTGNYFAAPRPGNEDDPCNASKYTIYTSTPWCYGRVTFFGNRPNPLGMLTWMGASAIEGLDGSKVNRADSPWWYAYYLASLFSLEEMGYDKARPARQVLAKAAASQVMDSGAVGVDGTRAGPVLLGEYRRIVQDKNGNSPATWQQVLDGNLNATSLAGDLSATDTTFQISNYVVSPNCGVPTGLVSSIYIDQGMYLMIDRGQPSQEIVKVYQVGCGNPAKIIVTTTGQRGALNTKPQPHAAGATVERLYVSAHNASYSSKESGQYIQALGSLSAAYDITVQDSVNGQPYPGLRAFEVMRQNAKFLEWNSATKCTGVATPTGNCMNWMWDLFPPHVVQNAHAVALDTSAQIVFTAPDPNACKVGISPQVFTSSDDSSDAAVKAGPPSRSYNATNLTPGTTYYYRITCGPQGGTARATGTFTTALGPG